MSTPQITHNFAVCTLEEHLRWVTKRILFTSGNKLQVLELHQIGPRLTILLCPTNNLVKGQQSDK